MRPRALSPAPAFCRSVERPRPPDRTRPPLASSATLTPRRPRREFEWKEPFGTVVDYNFHRSKGEIFCRWFEGGVTNICYNAIDRHLAAKRDEPCMIYEGNDRETTTLTWGELHSQVCKFANVLKSHGVKKGDRVAVYMPMLLELPIAMLACARIGAMHSVVFGGFSAEALAQRIVHSGSTILVTADGVMRATKFVELKSIADAAMDLAAAEGHTISTCIMFERKPSGMPAEGVPMVAGRDLSWAAEMSTASPVNSQAIRRMLVISRDFSDRCW